jgi:hypothetical protein
VTVELDGLQAHVTVAGPALPRGQAVALVFRPETIGLHESDHPEGVPATIASRTFLGEKVEYRVQVGEQVLQVVGYHPRKVFAAGQGVRVILPETDVPVLTGEG